MADVGVLQLTIKDNSERAGKGLDSLGDALVRVKHAVTGGLGLSSVSKEIANLSRTVQAACETNGVVKNLNEVFKAVNQFGKLKGFSLDGDKLRDYAKSMTSLAEAQDRIVESAKQTGKDGNYWDNMLGNSEAKKAIDGAQDNLKSLKGLIKEVKDSGSTELANAWGKQASRGRSSSQRSEGQIEMDLDSLLKKTETVTETVTQEYKEMIGAVEKTPLDFTKFDPSDLPLSALGMTVEQYRNGKREALEFADAVKSAETVVLSMKAKADAARFDENENKAIILYQENMENSWERICNRMGSANDELEEYVKHQKEVIFGNESIQGLWENPNIGPSLQGFFGTETQTAMIEKIAEATGLSTDNIVEQLYKLSNGMVDLRKTAETVSDSAAVQRVKDDIAGIGIESEDAISKIQLLNNKIEHLWGVYNRLSEMPEIDEMGNPTGRNNAMNNVLLQIGSAYEQLDRLIDKAHEAQDAMQFDQMKASAAEAIEQRPQWSQQDVSNLVENYTEVDLLEMKLRGLQQALMDDINQNKLDTQQIADRTIAIQNLQDRIDELKDSQEEATESTRSFGESFKEFKKGLKDAFPLLNNLAKKLKGIIIKRTLTAAVKKIAAGAKEGLQNVYEYSKMIGSSFAPSMDSAASAIAQMKNSLGAALAPALQAIIPLLQQLVNGFISVVNWVNQLFSLLNGQKTWTRALPQTTSAFEKQTKAAKKTGAAIKDLLADWDELNIIQSQTSGSGGTTGKAAEDYLAMFEEVNKFDSKAQKIVGFIKDNMDEILGIAKEAGLAIMAWKVSGAFTGVLSDMLALVAAGMAIKVSWDLTTIIDRQFMKDGEDGWLVTDALVNLLGATLAGGIVTTVLGGAAGLVSAGIELTVSAGISYGIAYANEAGDKANVLKKLAAIKGAIGLAAMSVGFGIATGSALLGILSAALVAAPLFTLTAAITIMVEQYRSAEEIAREAFSKTGEGGINVQDIFGALQDELTSASSGYSLVIDAFSGAAELKQNLSDSFASILLLSATVKGGGKLTQKEADEFKNAWTTVFDAFKGLTEKSFDTVFAGLNKSLQSENEEIRKQAKELRVSVLMMQENLSEAIAEFQIEQQDLADKIGKGTATSDEVDQYFKNLEIITKSSKNSLVDFEKVIATREAIDFGDPVDAVENAVQFITDSQNAAKEAIEKINEGYNDEMGALDTLWRSVEIAHDVGKISDEQFATYESLFSSMRDNFKKAADNEKEKVSSTVQSAYQAVIDQALSGITNLKDVVSENGNIDMLQIAAYMTEVMIPVLGAAKDAGMEFSEDFQKMFGIGISMEQWTSQGWAKKLEDYIKKDILGMDIESVVEDAVNTSKVEPEIIVEPKLAYEFDPTSANDLYREINALIDKAGIYGKDRTDMSNLLLRLEMDRKVDELKKIYDYINSSTLGAVKWYDWYNQENGNTGYAGNASRFKARADSISDVGLGKYDSTPSDPSKIGDVWGVIDTVTKRLDEMQDELTRDDMTKAVETGTKNANRDQEDIVRSILSGVNALLRKNWTVNVNATSSLGMVNRASAAKVARITGHSYIP